MKTYSNKNGKMKISKHKPKLKLAQIVRAEVTYSLFLLVCKFT